MRTRHAITLAILFSVLLFFASPASAASPWDFSQNWDSGYTDNQWIPSTGSPWSSWSSWNSTHGASTDTYHRKSPSYSAHLGYWSGYTGLYDWYLDYDFGSTTPAKGELKFWLFLEWADFDVRFSANKTNWTTVTISGMQYSGAASNRTVTVPSGTRYIRFHTRTDIWGAMDGAWVDDITYVMPTHWIVSVSGYDATGVNGETLNLTATAASITGYTITAFEWQTKKFTDADWSTYIDPSGGTVSIYVLDTSSFSDPLFQFRCRAIANGSGSEWFEATIDVQNVSLRSITLEGDPPGGVFDIALDVPPPELNMTIPPNPWHYVEDKFSYYSYLSLVDRNEKIPVGGTATYFYNDYKCWIDFNGYYYFMLWEYVSGNTYKLVAKTPQTTLQIVPTSYALTGSQWTNLPANLHIGAFLYNSFIYQAPFDGNGPTHTYNYTSSSSTSYCTMYANVGDTWTRMSSTSSTNFSLPFRVKMSGIGHLVESARVRYHVGEGNLPVNLPDAAPGPDGLLHTTFESWAIDSDDVWFDLSFNNGRWTSWTTVGPFEIRNRIDVTFQTNVNEQEPAGGTFNVEVIDPDTREPVQYALDSGDSVQSLYYQDITVEAPQYVFDENDKRWRWSSWDDDGSRRHTISTSPGMDAVRTATYTRQYGYFIESIRDDFSGTEQGWYDPGAEIIAIAERYSIETEGQERYKCNGYTVDALEMSGTSLEVTFILDRDVILVWLWEAQYFFESIHDYNTGVGNLPGWYTEGTHITYEVAEYYPNGLGARLKSNGYYLSGILYPGVHTFETNIDSYTLLDWVWIQQFYLEARTNAGTVVPEFGWYDKDETISVVATPPESDNLVRYTFLKWDGIGAGVVKRVGGLPVADVTMGSPIIQEAYWAIEYHLILTSDLGSFSPDVSGWYAPGTEVVINGVPPGTNPGSRYLPEWSSEDEFGINDGPFADTPLIQTVVMNWGIRQAVNWHLQHSLTINNPEGIGYVYPEVGEYWIFDGELIYGFCEFAAGDRVCSGYASTGSIQSSDVPFFSGYITSPVVVNWQWRDRELLPTFGLDAPEALPVVGPVSFGRTSTGAPDAVYGKSNGNLVYAVWSGTAWVETTVATSLNNYDGVDHTTLPNGELYICLHEPGVAEANLTLFIPADDPVSGAGFVAIPIEFAGDIGINPHIAVNFEGTVFISFYAAAGALMMAEISAEGEVVRVDMVDDEGNPGYHNSIGVDPIFGRPVIAYRDAFSRSLLISIFSEEGVIDRECIDDNGNVGFDCELIVGRSGELYIAYRDATYADKEKVKFAHLNHEGWSIKFIDAAGSVGSGLSFAMGGDEYPHLLYYGEDFLRLTRFVGTGWEIYTLLRGIAPEGRTAVTTGVDNRAMMFYIDDGLPKYLNAKTGSIRPDNVTPGTIDPGIWGPDGSGGGGCFIATAAFGSLSSSTVASLTGFRDSSLAASLPGSALRDIYYLVSPSVAVCEGDAVRAVIRRFLK